ncbi:hypothetical protein [Bradyrhizobium elkanii]|uniref:Uncharacterized protein n=1 Tax=Bradyrhizobium elkanii TaxID=29448 RepID=A0ABV4FBW1_BRAEL|nr:hypothetical protein [Bradyrhizobium elkanii]MCP1752001.1 hypothetical protein [Bradyrhizobium elkanii]MCP1977772.1 hypothetical protein [Bradyrhizobium elkanii]MCS3887711.1 hypothetical protein [Bradyrhizobium elkanii]MCS4213270.1 hypothetical protein [Bradyrhizobium elkanii]MCW2213577.1 hypothetical protein [Bradyrhizobium elkanii]
MRLAKEEFDKFIGETALHIGSDIASEPVEERDLHLEAVRLALVEVARKHRCSDDEVDEIVTCGMAAIEKLLQLVAGKVGKA